MDYGSRISQARKRKGWKQADLGRKIGCPRQLISKWERNLNTPSLENALKMAEVLGTTVDSLFGMPAERSELELMVRELPDESQKYLKGLIQSLKEK